VGSVEQANGWFSLTAKPAEMLSFIPASTSENSRLAKTDDDS
jgi:hypothetical protein